MAHPLFLLSSQCWPQAAQVLVGGTGDVCTAHGTGQSQAWLVLLPRLRTQLCPKGSLLPHGTVSPTWALWQRAQGAHWHARAHASEEQVTGIHQCLAWSQHRNLCRVLHTS